MGYGVLGCWLQACRHAWHCNGKRVRCLGVSAIQPLTSRQDAVAPLALAALGPNPGSLFLNTHPRLPRGQVALVLVLRRSQLHFSQLGRTQTWPPWRCTRNATPTTQPARFGIRSILECNACSKDSCRVCLIMTEFHGTRQTRAGIERVRRYNEATAPTAASPCGWSGCSCLCGGRTHSLLLHLPVHAACQG